MDRKLLMTEQMVVLAPYFLCCAGQSLVLYKYLWKKEMIGSEVRVGLV